MQLSDDAAGATAADIDFRELMEEPAGGHNYGRAATTDPEKLGRTLPLSVEESQARELLQAGGWTLIPGVGGARQDAGMTAHRGVLHPDEYVDRERLVGLVERALGFSFDDVHAVYRQGRLSDEQRALRDRLDARLLELQRAGANMTSLGYVLGLGVTPDGHCRAIQAAVARARAAEAVAA